MAHVPGLRSPSEQVNGLVYFGRMLDKIRLTEAGKLPVSWQAMRGSPDRTHPHGLQTLSPSVSNYDRFWVA